MSRKTQKKKLHAGIARQKLRPNQKAALFSRRSHRSPAQQARQAGEVGRDVFLELRWVVRGDHESLQLPHVGDDLCVHRVRLDSELGWIRLGWIVLRWVGLGWTGLGRVGFNVIGNKSASNSGSPTCTLALKSSPIELGWIEEERCHFGAQNGGRKPNETTPVCAFYAVVCSR